MSDEGILKAKYRQVDQAMVAKDTSTLAKLLKPDTVLGHMKGYVQPVSEWLAQIETGEMTYYSWHEEAIKNLKIEGTKASLIGQSQVKSWICKGPANWYLQIEMFFEKQAADCVTVKQVASTY